MFNLLKANLFKLFKERSFYIVLAVMVGLQIFSLAISASMTITDEFGNAYSMHNAFSNYIGTLSVMNGTGFFAAIAISIYIAKEFSHGAIRNKIAVGHSRVNIYLSNIITAVIMMLILQLAITLVLLADVSVSGWDTGLSVTEAVTQIACGFIILIVSACVNGFVSMITRSNQGILFNILGIFVFTIILMIISVPFPGEVWEVVNKSVEMIYLGQSVLLATKGTTMSFFSYTAISGAVVITATVVGGAMWFKKLDIK